MGTVSQVTRFMGVANSVDIDTGEWYMGSGAANVVGSADVLDAQQAIFVSENIIYNNLVQNTNSGVLEALCLWEPLSADASLT